MEKSVGVLIAYDNFMYREGLKVILNEENIRIVAEEFIVQRVLYTAQIVDVNVVIMGTSWYYDDSSIDVIRKIKSWMPDKKIVAISETQTNLRKAKKAGADISLTTRVSKDELINAIMSVSRAKVKK